MNDRRKIYSGKDLALIVPTKDRPQKIRKLLGSIAGQTETCGRLIIVDGGESVKDAVMEFAGSIPVEYHECSPPGQIRQRNMGIGLLDKRNILVGFLDDDIVLEPDALENMLDFWNLTATDTAGVGFNIINDPNTGYTSVLSKLLVSRNVPGRVLASGINTSFQNISSDIQTQWLGGGYTIWRQTILKEYSQDDLRTRWAIGEDLRFSYPVGKKYPLYVCAGARVRHEHIYDQASEKEVHFYQGRKHALAMFYFVRSHQELSPLACFLSLSVSCVVKIILGSLTLDFKTVKFALGISEGVLVFVKSIFGSVDLRKELED